VARFRTRRLDSLLVLNPSGLPRTDLVAVFCPRSRIDADRPLAVVDVERGERVQHSFDSPEMGRNRPQGRVLSFLASDVPALGYRRFELVGGEPDPSPGEPAALENEHYRLELDVEGACAVRLIDRALGVDLVDPVSAFGVGQVVRDLYGGPLQATMRVPAGPVAVTYAEGREPGALIAARSVPTDGVVRERVSNAVEERVTVRSRAAGLDRIETTFRLVRGVRRVDVSIRLVKPATVEKESVHVVFPFAANDPAPAYELTGGVGSGPGIPGSAAHMHAIRHWIALQDDAALLAWATLQAPLVQLGNVFLPYPPYPGTIDGAGAGLVTSWVTNNVWDTNFPRAQGGELRVDYAIASATPRGDARALGIATADALTRPLVGALGATAPAAVGSVCDVNAPGVEVVMLTADAVHLQSYADGEVAVRVAGREVRVAPGDYVTVPLGSGA
jgi:hypothetical protein